MKGLSIDEIVNTSNLNTKASNSRDDITQRLNRMTPDRSFHGDAIQITNSPGRNHANQSGFSMGITPKQVSIVENTMAKAANMGKGMKNRLSMSKCGQFVTAFSLSNFLFNFLQN